MPIVSGVIAYDSANTYTFPNAIPSGRIQSGVPVVLQNTITGVGLVVLTNASGAFSFGTVPAGSYSLIEAWGASGGVVSPGDFSTATVINPPTPQDPPISKAPSPPPNATRLQSLTRNTIPITVTTADVTGQNFVDAPIVESSIVLRQSNILGNNLITSAQTGAWGTLPTGTTNQNIAPTAPFPSNVPSLTYNSSPSSVGNNAGTYNASNMCYYGTYNTFWWSISNHTTFDETSRMMIINAAGGGPASNERFFSTTIPVTPNTYYIGFAWVANLINVNAYVTPQVGVKVSTTGGTLIFNSPTPQLVYSNPPQWVQIGGVFNTGNNSVVNVEYQSLASGTAGNDFTADDFSVYQLQITPFLNSMKYVDKAISKVGDILNYKVVLNNTGSITAESVIFQDTAPMGTSFQNGSVTVNNTQQISFNPNTGFNIGGIASGKVATIDFKVSVVSVPPNGFTLNNSTSNYNFSPVQGGVTIPLGLVSNSVQTYIVNSSLTKFVSKNYEDLNTTISYTLVYSNLSYSTATNVVFIDTIPIGTTFDNTSFYANGNRLIGSPNPPGVTLPDVPPNSTLTITFNVLTPNSIAQSPVRNSGTIQGIFTDTIGNAYTMTVNSNITTTTIATAILTSRKVVNKYYANIGDILTYTIPITNTGNVTANNIIFLDTIPSGTTFIPNSLKQDGVIISQSSNPPGVTLPNTIKANGTTTITFQVQVVTIPMPNSIANSASVKASYTIDSTTTPNKIGTTSTNSNVVFTQINRADLSRSTKYVDKSYADCGDILNYTIVIPNGGSVTAVNVLFKDTIPNGTNIISGTFKVNGVTIINTNPTSGVTLPNIAPLSTSTVTFSVLVYC